MDKRVLEYVNTEDPDIVLDLRKLNSRPAVYDPFFEKAAAFIASQIETAVDDRRHGTVTHLAMAMSAEDLHWYVIFLFLA